jgi:hypothetical protein
MSSQFLFWMARQHWPLQRLPVDHQLILIIKDMRNSLSEMLAILISTLTQDVAEQYAAPGRIHNVLEGTPDRGDQSHCLVSVALQLPFSGFIAASPSDLGEKYLYPRTSTKLIPQ